MWSVFNLWLRLSLGRSFINVGVENWGLGSILFWITSRIACRVCRCSGSKHLKDQRSKALGVCCSYVCQGHAGFASPSVTITIGVQTVTKALDKGSFINNSR